MQYKRFDRHEVFNGEDRTLVLDCIQHIDKYDYENGGAELSNMLFGLFDGYYYDKIHKLAALLLPVDMFEQLEDLLVRVDVWITAKKMFTRDATTLEIVDQIMETL